MDIITHAISGLAVGTVVASISKKKTVENLKIIGFSGFGAVLPDIDAISLWSKFDGIFGKLFNLNYLGRDIYSMKLWYSHHGFFHSISAALLLTFCLGFVFYLFQRKKQSFFGAFQNNLPVLIGFFAGFLIHFFEDMPTPSGSWGGVRLFFPLKIYVGGTGNIWWWNNYDIFLIALSVFLINALILALRRPLKLKTAKPSIIVFFIGIVLIMIQIKTRNFDFNLHTYPQSEQKSQEIQHLILGDKWHKRMLDFDSRVKVCF